MLSGVGGQYNFVAQGHALEGARSILILRSWRESGGEVSSNMVWEYGHCTIPRHLRGHRRHRVRHRRPARADRMRKVIEALLNISDSRFQPGLDRAGAEGRQIAEGFPARSAFHRQHAGTASGDSGAAPALVSGVSVGLRFHGSGAGSVAGAELAQEQIQADARFWSWARLRWMRRSPMRFPNTWNACTWTNPEGLKEDLYQRLLLAGLKATAP